MDKVIQDIEESENLTFEEKLEALCELDDIMSDDRIMKGKNPQTLQEAFIWTFATRGPSYWIDLQTRIYGGVTPPSFLRGAVPALSEVPVNGQSKEGQPEGEEKVVYIDTPSGKVEVVHVGGTPEQHAATEARVRKMFGC